MKGDPIMKCRQVDMLIILFFGIFTVAHADVIVTQPGVAPLSPATTAAVVVPATVITPVIVPSPGVVVTDLEREGDWYVVYGQADLDRYHTILRVKDEKHGW